MTNNNVSFSSGFALFNYNRRAVITNLNPSMGTDGGGTDVLVGGNHLLNTTSAACMFGNTAVPAKFLSNQAVLCTAPPHLPGVVSVELTSNGADFSMSGALFTYYPQANVVSVWPVLGSASEGGTIVTIHGDGFRNSAELVCKFGNTIGTEATWLSSTKLLCRTPPHRPGLVVVRVANNGADFSLTSSDFLYIEDPSLEDVRPTKVLETGQVPVMLKGSNFMNTTTLTCRFGSAVVRASFVAHWLVVCMAPSHSAQLRLQRKFGSFSVELSINGMDYTDSGQTIEYIHASPEGHYVQSWMPSLSPNGTYSAGGGGGNFTLCHPGSFQPSSGAERCLLCPVGFMCPGTFYLFVQMLACMSCAYQ